MITNQQKITFAQKLKIFSSKTKKFLLKNKKKILFFSIIGGILYLFGKTLWSLLWAIWTFIQKTAEGIKKIITGIINITHPIGEGIKSGGATIGKFISTIGTTIGNFLPYLIPILFILGIIGTGFFISKKWKNRNSPPTNKQQFKPEKAPTPDSKIPNKIPNIAIEQGFIKDITEIKNWIETKNTKLINLIPTIFSQNTHSADVKVKKLINKFKIKPEKAPISFNIPNTLPIIPTKIPNKTPNKGPPIIPDIKFELERRKNISKTDFKKLVDSSFNFAKKFADDTLKFVKQSFLPNNNEQDHKIIETTIKDLQKMTKQITSGLFGGMGIPIFT